MQPAKQNKKLYLEFIRIIAIILVVFDHTAASHFPFTHPVSGIASYISLLLAIIGAAAVPLFFMVSGALLLDREESISVLVKKRVSRILLVFLIFHVMQFLYGNYAYGREDGILDFINRCLSGNGIWPVTWFLYAYTAFLLQLPLLRCMVKNMQDGHFLYLFALQLMAQAFIPLEYTGFTTWLVLCNNVFLYILAGYYAEHRINVQSLSRKQWVKLIGASACSILFSMLMCEINRRMYHYEAFSAEILCFRGGLLIPCISFYLLLKKAYSRPVNACLSTAICAMGGAAFSIMIFDAILRDAARVIMHILLPHSYLADKLSFILACMMGFPLGIALKKIPGLKRLL